MPAGPLWVLKTTHSTPRGMAFAHVLGNKKGFQACVRLRTGKSFVSNPSFGASSPAIGQCDLSDPMESEIQCGLQQVPVEKPSTGSIYPLRVLALSWSSNCAFSRLLQPSLSMLSVAASGWCGM